jgi:hypothetical protein
LRHIAPTGPSSWLGMKVHLYLPFRRRSLAKERLAIGFGIWDTDLTSPLYYGREQVAQDLEGGWKDWRSAQIKTSRIVLPGLGRLGYRETSR